MEQAIRLVPTLPPWVKENIHRAGTLADMEMKKRSYAALHKEENSLNAITWLQTLANNSTVTFAPHYYHYSFRWVVFFFCIAAISKIISIVYYYLLLDIPTFSRNLFVLCQWFLVSFHGFSDKFLQPNVPATQQPPIKDTKVKPKQEPPQTP